MKRVFSFSKCDRKLDFLPAWGNFTTSREFFLRGYSSTKITREREPFPPMNENKRASCFSRFLSQFSSPFHLLSWAISFFCAPEKNVANLFPEKGKRHGAEIQSGFGIFDCNRRKSVIRFGIFGHFYRVRESGNARNWDCFLNGQNPCFDKKLNTWISIITPLNIKLDTILFRG